ncbi:hypothetical protein MtrunA17_Chr3g0120171 [Medicago truncatula]|uniref:Uncharacterized protein n=1 Tax=Medicago truncatula TaxID=3880 RepID=I3STI9_MEDTR|nr:unknown [Medicago truncatula]RHN69013.1 hypothetical protein MtrunA17_Chr3g0120171 [Medicago truncatula]
MTQITNQKTNRRQRRIHLILHRCHIHRMSFFHLLTLTQPRQHSTNFLTIRNPLCINHLLTHRTRQIKI